MDEIERYLEHCTLEGLKQVASALLHHPEDKHFFDVAIEEFCIAYPEGY